MLRLIVFSLLCLYLIFSCVPPEEAKVEELVLDVKDMEYQRLYNFQDGFQLDSLLKYSQNSCTSYRSVIANAFASFQESKAVDTLITFLKDPSEKVRAISAYSLGQIGGNKSAQALVSSFIKKDTGDVNNIFNQNILEAVGKSASIDLLHALSTVSTYRPDDDHLLKGQALGIYRFALRNITSEEGTKRMIDVLSNPSYPEDTRLIAANYLYRAKDINIEPGKYRISEAFVKTNNPNIKMFLALALGKIKDDDILDNLKEEYDASTDYRVKVNILRSMETYPYSKIIDKILEGIKDPNEHIALAAAGVLVKSGISEDASIYPNYLDGVEYPKVIARVYEAALQNIPNYYKNSKRRLTTQIQNKFNQESDPYNKAAFLMALAVASENYNIVAELGFQNESKIVQTATVNALKGTLKKENLGKVYKTAARQRRVKRDILELLKNQAQSNDPGIIFSIASLIQDESLELKSQIQDYSWLEQTRSAFQSPKDIEALKAVNAVVAFLKNEEYSDIIPNFNHPIDWQNLLEVGDTTRAKIVTEKGSISFQLFYKHAPGTVANFVRLAKENFYDGKVFNRVVPNFVIQGGCPRGDGFGSLDYSIRSELGPKYFDDEGYVGMASAGIHTESVQFFITHSPTMHLDGKYTIFGKVTEGMDVVHKIQQGDLITDVQILNY